MLELITPRPTRSSPPLAAAPTTVPTLRLEGLAVHRQRLSLSLAPGEAALVEGGSRAERLRVLGIAAGLSHAGPGRCWLQGRDTLDGPPEARRALRRQAVGRLLSVDTLPDGVSMRGAVAMPLLAAGMRPQQAFDRASDLLEALGVASIVGWRSDRLGRRERRLALLARALAASPPLLVLEDLDDALLPHDIPGVRAALRVATSVDDCALLFTCAEPRLMALADQRVNMD